MTTLSKKEIIAWARAAGFAKFLKPESRPEMICGPDEVERFAHLCRADLVEEIRTLKADAENFRPTIGLVDKLQLERDDLRAEIERLKSKSMCVKHPRYSTYPLCPDCQLEKEAELRAKDEMETLRYEVDAIAEIKAERDALRAEIERLAVKLSHTQLDCQTEAATVVALRAENERLASLAKEYRDNGDRLLDVTNSLKAELSALRAGSGEAVKPLPGADWTITMRRMMTGGCSKRKCTCKAGNEQHCIWWDEPGDAPQPSAVPVVRELVEALEAVEALIEHQYTGTRDGMNALQNAADDAHDALKTGQQWLKECGE